MTAATIEPFGFFTWDSLRAGWYLSWRLFVRVVPVFAAATAVGFVLLKSMPLGPFLMAIGFIAGAVWSLMLIPKLTSQWAQERYGYPLENPLQVWWGITWRSFVVSMVAAVIMAVPNVVAVSFQTAYKDSMLGMLAGLVLFVLYVANIAVSILGTGWAMSRVTAAQLSGLDPAMATAASTTALGLSPLEPDPPMAVEPEPAPRPTPRAAPTATLRTTAQGKRQCPKCGLYETERGSVIGWYCRVCGWREARR